MLKLVSDNATELPVANLQDIAGMARKFADDLDRFGEIVSVTLLIETSDNLHRETWGECPTSYELLGMLEAAKHAILDEAIQW